MNARIPDFVPSPASTRMSTAAGSPPPPAESRHPAPMEVVPPRPARGGRRPGAGAPQGNLNALRHGRRSRFRHHLEHEPDALAVAGRLLARHRRAAERRAATLLEVALVARHERALADALETGSPPPPPLLLGGHRPDLYQLKRMILEDTRDRRRAAIPRHPDDPEVRGAKERAAQLDAFVHRAAVLLDRTLSALPHPAVLATLLPPPDNQPFNQPLPGEGSDPADAGAFPETPGGPRS